jgi:hypothetical protein
MTAPPCKGCTDRHDLCHSDCEQYLEFRRKYEAEKRAYEEEKTITGAISALNHKAAFTRKDGSRRREGWKIK